MGRIKDTYMDELEVRTAFLNDIPVPEEDMPGSEAYHQRLVDEHAITMWERIEDLELRLAHMRDRMPAADLSFDQDIEDMWIVISQMKRIMPALDRELR